MRSSHSDTIAAIATPPGRGGISIVRISGKLVGDIAKQVLDGIPEPRCARLSRFVDADGGAIDEGLALFFAGPNSFTGEDVLELHGHGGPIVADLILQRVLRLGARIAQPGEFSQRAFLNDKLDLAQAEALADLIDSGSEQAARAAMRSLQGEFSARIGTLAEALTNLRTYIEAAIDFPEEEVDFLSDKKLLSDIDDIQGMIVQVSNEARQGCLLQEGMTVVIAGRPNAGKSSLLNRLAGYDAAIVTKVPGTTRDVVKEFITVDGMPLHVLDTAGLRESKDIVEQEGVRRTHHAIGTADRVLLVTDSVAETDEAPDPDAIFEDVPLTIVRNKIDLSGEREGLVPDAEPPVVRISAKTGAGVDVLRQHLKDCVGYQAAGTGTLSARRRHLEALNVAEGHVREARRQLDEFRAGELAAEELKLAHQALGEITGEFTTEDLLGCIFSTFCIGK